MAPFERYGPILLVGSLLHVTSTDKNLGVLLRLHYPHGWPRRFYYRNPKDRNALSAFVEIEKLS